MHNAKGIKKRAVLHIAVIGALGVMLALTTLALVTSFVRKEDNLFETGQVKIELNGGQTIFNGEDMNLEPGRAAVRPFTVENVGNADAYVRLYLENVEGSLENALTFAIYEGEEQLYSGKASELTKENPCIDKRALAAGEIRTLTAVVTMEEEAGNAYEDGGLTFDMTADAVQVRNNPDIAFE